MNDKAKIAALRAALKAIDIEAGNGLSTVRPGAWRETLSNIRKLVWDAALTADDAEQAMCDDGAECGMGGYCITCPHVPTPAPIAAEPAPMPWQDRMAEHYQKGKSVQLLPTAHFMQQEIYEWRDREKAKGGK